MGGSCEELKQEINLKKNRAHSSQQNKERQIMKNEKETLAILVKNNNK